MAVLGQTNPTEKPFTNYSGRWLHTESIFPDSSGGDVIIQNSYPKGGSQYTDATGRTFSYVIFWTRVMNETGAPIELTIKFPADSFPLNSSSHSYVKVFLPPGKMTLEKESLFNYGITEFEPFLDTGFNKRTSLQRMISSKRESIFYTALLLYHIDFPIRSAFILKREDLFYTINNGSGHDTITIPCGRLIIKKTK
ncbi:MAG: hypothetical protein CK547_02330 [Chitinophagaceae bacterium]|nr:MAG: hypothetical protein CK547_02330 [Chitinophagaceae bacterium]